MREGLGYDLVFATINKKEWFVKTHIKFVHKVWGILKRITPFHTIWYPFLPNAAIALKPPP